MKILIIQENGRHKENREFRECYSLKRSLGIYGVESEIWGLGFDNFNLNFNDLSKNFDVLFILENYDDKSWIPDLSNINKFKVFWSIDSHCNPIGHKSLVDRHKVDLVLNSIESHKKLFKNCYTSYFPNACDTNLVYPIESIEKTTLMGFCGTPFQYRINSMEIIEKKFGLNIKKDFWVLGSDMVKVINGYKIHFNQSENEDINYRVFETLSTKTLLLTSKNENIESFFEDMKDALIYSNEKEMLDKIDFIIKNDDMIPQISKNGYNKIISNHSYDVRAKQLIDILKLYI